MPSRTDIQAEDAQLALAPQAVSYEDQGAPPIKEEAESQAQVQKRQPAVSMSESLTIGQDALAPEALANILHSDQPEKVRSCLCLLHLKSTSQQSVVSCCFCRQLPL